MYLPDWIQEHKEPRTEIKRIKNGFYKYEVAFVYNKEKKRTEKKTIRLLGKITQEEGFVPSAKDALRRKSEVLPQVDIVCCSCTSVQGFDYSFLQIPLHNGHPCLHLYGWRYQPPLRTCTD